MAPEFRHVRRGRSLSNALPLAIGLAMLGYGLNEGAPWIVLAPVVLGIALFAWPLASGRTWTFEIAGDEVAWSVGTRRTALPARDVERLRFREWTDSTDLEVQMADGRSVPVPAPCLPPRVPALQAAASARGIGIVVE